jgi:hypothetical protein
MHIDVRDGISPALQAALDILTRHLTALANHPCWATLSRFGTPYPPFDFGSGMGTEPISAAEAADLGIIPPPAAPDDWSRQMQPDHRSLNETLQASGTGYPRDLREDISDTLQGLAEWDGDTLIFTDPNGTKPYPAPELADIITAPLPKYFKDLPGNGQIQQEAFVDWVSHHEDYAQKGQTNRWEDLLRLHARIQNTQHPTLYRGISMPAMRADAFFRNIELSGTYSPREIYPVESWTNSKNAAIRYAQAEGKHWSVLVEMAEPTDDWKDVSPLVRKLRDKIRKKSIPPVETESEWLLRSGVVYRAKDALQNNLIISLFVVYDGNTCQF